MREFDYQQNLSQIDFRQHPELVEPYKSEILPHWRFRTPAIARESAEKIMALFEEYRQQDDFVGMDMARKFIQMGFTRARRYANHPGGKKYDAQRQVLPQQLDPEKVESATIFKAYWDKIRADADYLRRKKAHQQRYG